MFEDLPLRKLLQDIIDNPKDDAKKAALCQRTGLPEETTFSDHALRMGLVVATDRPNSSTSDLPHKARIAICEVNAIHVLKAEVAGAAE